MEVFLYACGFIAAILMVISPFVQLVETYQKKTVEGLSLWMLITLFIGCFLMGLRVAITTHDIPLLLNYVANVVIVGVNIWFFFIYRKS